MRKLPSRLGFSLIVITIFRVSDFVVFGLKIGWLGYAFAIAIAAGVYASAFFTGFEKSRWWAWFALVCFGFTDMWFNVFEVIRTLAPEQLIPPSANFLNYSYEQLQWGLQLSAVIYAVAPTMLAGVLGILQSRAELVAELKTPSLSSRISMALGKIVTGWGIAVAVKLEKDARNAPRDAWNSPQVASGPRRWKSITADEVARIPQMNRAEIKAYFGIEDGTAGEWKRRIDAGERPWLKDGQKVARLNPPNSAEK